MDKQSSWTKGSSNDFKHTHKYDKSSTPPSNYQSSFEFLDMSSCDETQKLKLKNTLEMKNPLFSAVTSMPSRDRSNMEKNIAFSNFVSRNSKAKSQKSNHQSFSTKDVEHSSRLYSLENNSFSSKNNSNFNNYISTNINDNRHFPNTQDKTNKWQTLNKKPTTVGIRETIPINSKEISTKRSGGGSKDLHFHHQQSKEVTRDFSKSFNRNMSPPPLTSFQTNTTSTATSSSSSSTQGNMPLPHFQYGSHPQMYPQMYHPMDHQSSSTHQQHPRSGRRGGRSRGGNNNINRRDFQIRQNNHHQQNQQPNEYGQPLMDPNQQGVVMSSAPSPYQQVYIHYPPWQNPMPQNMNLTQNLTGQPLFAIQQPLLYQYGSYPIMYNVMPQGHPMSHQQPEMMENDVQEPLVWPQVAHPQQIFQHSPHHSGVEIDFQADYIQADEYQPEEIEIEGASNAEDVYEENEEILVEKTRDLMIQTTPPIEDSVLSNETFIDATSESLKHAEPAAFEKIIDNKMIVKNVEKPPAWGNSTVPNLSAQQKKQMASVSVSAIPNKDVENCETSQNTLSTRESQVESKESSISFSTIAGSKQTITQPEGKKTENKQNEVLIERAKQQIVTTITGVGSNQENEKSFEATPETVKNEVDLTVTEKGAQNAKLPSAATVVSSPSPPSSAKSWAGLFNSKAAGGSKIASQPQTNSQSSETQKLSTAKNSESLLAQAPQLATPAASQVPNAMSYSAVSAQFAAPLTNSQSSGGTKNLLPQSKMNLPNNIDVNENSNNNNNHVKTAPVDQHALKLGDFFSKYKIESNSISLLPRGLLNKSNYCYINAILQALVSCPPFYHLMKSIPQMPTTYRNHTKTPVIDAMIELVSNYSLMPYRKWAPREKGKKDDVPEIARDTAFEPTIILKMLQALRTEMFPIEGRQEDAEEFLSFILNRMNDEMIELKKLVEKPKALPKKEENGDDVNGNVDIPVDDDDEWQVISGTRNKSTITRTTDFGRSPISDIFGGKLRLRVHREGDHSSDNIEPFFTLKLVIEKASSVREALEILVGRDQLEGVTCSRTNQEVAAWQQVTLEELPVVLILHLKCFDFKKDGCTKILKTVEFPVELKLDQKIMASKSKYQQKQKQYKLFAIVYHDGKEASKGHYITDVFHLSYSSWIRYDDSSVKAVSESNVLHPKSPRVPYLLFYRRFDTIGGGQASKIQPNKV